MRGLTITNIPFQSIILLVLLYVLGARSESMDEKIPFLPNSRNPMGKIADGVHRSPITSTSLSHYFGASSLFPVNAFDSTESSRRIGTTTDSRNTVTSGVMDDHAEYTSEIHTDKMEIASQVANEIFLSDILRDNLVTVFGYILNLRENPLDSELYYSLYHIYSSLKIRRVYTLNLLPVLTQMAHVSPEEQFKIIFRGLSTSVPRYLVSSVEIWREKLDLGVINVNGILRPGGGALIVNLLAGIPREILIKPDEMYVPLGEVNPQIPTSITETMGKSMALIISRITENDIPLSINMFAGILSHRPRNKVIPQCEEMERHLTKYFLDKGVPGWNNLIENVNMEDYSDPVLLVRKILSLLSTAEHLENEIRDTARYILPYVEDLRPTFVNEFYDIHSNDLSKPTLDLSKLLSSITRLEFPEYVIDLRRRLTYYIGQRYIDMETITTGFNRFDYENTNDLLIALLTRIGALGKNTLPHEIYSTVNSLNIFLIFKKLSTKYVTYFPDNLIDINALVSDFGSPNMPKSVVDLHYTIMEYLRNDNVDWKEVTEFTTYEQCTHPRQCFLHLAKEAVNKGLFKDKNSTTYLERLTKQFTPDGEVILQNNFTVVETIPVDETIHKITIIKDSDTSINKRLYPNLISENPSRFYSKQHPENKTIDLCELVQPGAKFWFYPIEEEHTTETDAMVLFSPVFEEEPAFPDHPELLIPPTVPGSPEDLNTRRIRILLMQKHLYSFLCKSFNPHAYPKKGQLLRALLKQLLRVDFVRNDYVLFRQIETLLKQLSYQKFMSKTIITVNFNNLLKALPTPSTLDEKKMYNAVKNFLAYGNLTRLLGEHLQTALRKFTTTGAFMKYLIKTFLSMPIVKEDNVLLNALNYYYDNVSLNGYGAEGLDIVSFETTSVATYEKTIDINSLFDALDYSKFTENEFIAKMKLVNFFYDDFHPTDHLKDFNYSLYKTKGAFLQALFHYILEMKSVNSDVQECIETLQPLVLLSGKGADPVFSY